MKKQNVNNLRTKIIFISLTILSYFLLIINFIPFFGGNIGIITKYLRELEVDRLTHVNQSNPNMNYYILSSKGTEFGNSCEAYIHYNLEILPRETDALHLIINHYSFHTYPRPEVEDIEVNLILVESNWNYSKITWNNKPNHKELINTINISEITQTPWNEYDLEKTINLTEIFKETQLSEISFCINITENNPEMDYYIGISDIRLIYTYKVFVISYTTIISSILIFSMLIGMLYFIRKDIYFCPNCGNKIIFENRLCLSCENRILNDILIRRLYYQILIILIWILIFVEGFVLIYMLIWIYFIMTFEFVLLYFPVICLFTMVVTKNVKKFKILREIIKL